MLLTVFTVYVLLDTFVIRDVYQIAAEETEAVEQVRPTELLETVSTDSVYQDENISITLTQYREYDSEIYVAEVI